MSVDIHARLTALINTHATLFLELYGDAHAKVKFHHLFDLADDLLRIMGAVSCFVTERKNKDVKAVAESVSRHLERTATCSFLQNTVAHWRDNSEACLPAYLCRATRVTIKSDTDLWRAKQAVLPCGTVFRRDFIVLDDGSVGLTIDFFRWGDEADDDMHVRFERFTPNASVPLRFDRFGDGREVVHVSCIVEPCAWYALNPKSVVVALPMFE